MAIYKHRYENQLILRVKVIYLHIVVVTIIYRTLYTMIFLGAYNIVKK